MTVRMNREPARRLRREMKPRWNHGRVSFLMLFAMLCFSPGVIAQVYTYTKSVKALTVNGERIRVGMTHDKLLETLRRTRATATTADQTVQPDPDLPGSLWIQRYYSTPEGFKFLVDVRRTEYVGPYRVVRIALPEARK